MEPNAAFYNHVLLQMQHQVEFYFSESNLSRDYYMQNTLSTHYGAIPIFNISHFGRLQDIYEMLQGNAGESIEAMILRAMRNSPLVMVSHDGSHFRPIRLPDIVPMQPLEDNTRNVEFFNSIKKAGGNNINQYPQSNAVSPESHTVTTVSPTSFTTASDASYHTNDGGPPQNNFTPVYHDNHSFGGGMPPMQNQHSSHPPTPHMISVRQGNGQRNNNSGNHGKGGYQQGPNQQQKMRPLAYAPVAASRQYQQQGQNNMSSTYSQQRNNNNYQHQQYPPPQQQTPSPVPFGAPVNSVITASPMAQGIVGEAAYYPQPTPPSTPVHNQQYHHQPVARHHNDNHHYHQHHREQQQQDSNHHFQDQNPNNAYPANEDDSFAYYPEQQQPNFYHHDESSNFRQNGQHHHNDGNSSISSNHGSEFGTAPENWSSNHQMSPNEQSFRGRKSYQQHQNGGKSYRSQNAPQFHQHGRGGPPRHEQPPKQVQQGGPPEAKKKLSYQEKKKSRVNNNNSSTTTTTNETTNFSSSNKSQFPDLSAGQEPKTTAPPPPNNNKETKERNPSPVPAPAPAPKEATTTKERNPTPPKKPASPNGTKSKNGGFRKKKNYAEVLKESKPPVVEVEASGVDKLEKNVPAQEEEQQQQEW